MIVTLWRHGEARTAATDRQRQLTDRGRDDVSFGCHRFHDTCVERGLAHPDRLLHSPWVRTTQTADIVASAFSHARVQPCDALMPGMGVGDVDRALRDLDHPEDAHLVLVTHQPLVSRLVDYYLGETGRVPPLSPGALAVLRLDVAGPGCGTLLFWALPPEYEARV